MTDWIGTTFESTTGWSHLVDLASIDNRMAGTPGEREAAEATKTALGQYTRNARIDSFPVTRWDREIAHVETPSGLESGIGLPMSPDDDATGELVSLGYGLPDDFETTDLDGRVVLVRSDVPEYVDRRIHRREKYYRAVDAGAVGFVFQNHVEGGLPKTGSVGTSDGGVGEIPAVGVSKEVGSRLERNYDGTDITVSVSATISDSESHSVHAELGPRTDEEILLTSHLDAHDISEGAMDNGAGTAMLVEVARALSNRESRLETKLHLIAFGAEEVGLQGSTRDAAERNLETVSAVVNLDGVLAARTLSVDVNGFDGFEPAVEAVSERFDHPIEVRPTYEPHSDHWPYVERGVPGCFVSSSTDETGRGWGHTPADTLDKLDVRTFREQSILVSELLLNLAQSDRRIPNVSQSEIAAALEEAGEAEAMRVTGDWPYENVDT
ncbi:MAG: M28 family peptidase [Halodesulfurarchaeum sp.]